MSRSEPRPLRWTRDEYIRLSEEGWFNGRRVELIGGEILEMGAPLDLHAASVDLSRDALRVAFGAGFWVRSQTTLDLSPHGMPDPDLFVARGSPRGAGRTFPTSALLVVEVSDTSLAYDRNAKASLYAAAGITDYWIVNLVQRQLEVRRSPVTDAAALFGAPYSATTIHDPGDAVAPLAAPQAPVAVADLLP
jgi:Uma2 family endonuclease